MAIRARMSGAMDVARYGDGNAALYQRQGSRELSRRFPDRFPNEELTAARPLRTPPVYDRLQAEHAVIRGLLRIGASLWFAPVAAEATEQVPSAVPARMSTWRC